MTRLVQWLIRLLTKTLLSSTGGRPADTRNAPLSVARFQSRGAPDIKELIDPSSFLAGCRVKQLNQAHIMSYFLLSLDFFGRATYYGYCMFFSVCSLDCSGMVVSTSANDSLERLVSAGP